MNRRSRRKKGRGPDIRVVIAALCVLAVLALGGVAAVRLEDRLSLPVENAGQNLTAYQAAKHAAQYFVDGQWITQKDMETLLVIGIDEFGSVTSSGSYNNSNQADFMVLLVHDKKAAKSCAIHLNRDTMTEIPVLGVTGQRAGSIHGQLALAYTYGTGKEDSCKNTVEAVSNLLYGTEIDHYITVTMDAVPVLNDWAGGVTLEVLDDFGENDPTLMKGEHVKLMGQHALNYVRTRRGLEDSSNLHRMERQRQYASAWMEQAQPLFDDHSAMMELVLALSDYHYSDCTANELAELADMFAENPMEHVYTLKGENVQGDVFMEYYIDEPEAEKLVVDVFYEAVSR